METKILFIQLHIITIASIASCARILVVLPTPLYSHNVIYRTIYKELSLKGHEVVVFTPDPLKDDKLKNLTEIDMSFLYNQATYDNLFTGSQMGVAASFKNVLLKISRQIFLHPQMKRLVDDLNERFDLFLVEWNVNPSFTVLSKRFDCPMIGLRSTDLGVEGHDSVGNPTTPSYIPVGWRDFEETFWGRLDNFVYWVIWRVHHHLFIVPQAQQTADEFFPNYTDSVLEIEKNVSLVLTNTHPLLTTVRPIVPALIEVGGVHLKKEVKPIPKHILAFLDNAKMGVVYMNLGANVRSSNVNQKFLELLLSALSELSYKVMWRWEKADQPDLPLNVKIWNWLPQEAVLGHPNVKAFVTSGGLQSFLEAVDNHVPLVGIPFHGDQHLNVRRMEKLRIGKRLDANNFKKKAFISAVKKVAESPCYKKNIKRAAVILHDLPMKPLDKAIWWIEYVLRHKGARHFRSPAVDMDWFTYLLLDVICFTLLCVALAFGVIYYLFVLLKSALLSFKLKYYKVKTKVN